MTHDPINAAIIAGTRQRLADITAERDKYGRWIKDSLSHTDRGMLAAADMPRYIELEAERAALSQQLFALEAHAKYPTTHQENRP